MKKVRNKPKSLLVINFHSDKERFMLLCGAGLNISAKGMVDRNPSLQSTVLLALKNE